MAPWCTVVIDAARSISPIAFFVSASRMSTLSGSSPPSVTSCAGYASAIQYQVSPFLCSSFDSSAR
ncbi:MAG: hypothetical protein IPJ77_12715 [Planctomycetes bacterium]|nr:hypothetical protein [Planctomycetota bacterium]